MGFNYKQILILFKKYSKKIKYIDAKNIFKLIYGILIKRKIIINGLNSGEIIEELFNKEANKIFNEILQEVYQKDTKDTRISIDVNPNNMI